MRTSMRRMFQPFFYKFWTNIADSCWGWNLLFHGLAILGTYVFIVSGFDWYYLQFFWGNPMVLFLIVTAVMFGIAVPFLVMAMLLFYGKAKQNVQMLRTGYAMGQAAMVSFLISIIYKFFTGRIRPPYTDTQTEPVESLVDVSTVFNLGVYEGGIYEGWPSSHTAVAFAMSLALFVGFPQLTRVRIATVLFALYIGIGVSITDHWFSDFFAGAIIGTIVGLVVGKAFKNASVTEPGVLS